MTDPVQYNNFLILLIHQIHLKYCPQILPVQSDFMYSELQYLNLFGPGVVYKCQKVHISEIVHIK